MEINEKSAACLLGHYIKDKKKVIAAYIMITAIFLLICNLSRLDRFEDVFYAVIINSFLLGSFAFYDFYTYRKKYHMLLNAYRSLDEVKGNLPASCGLLEEGYQSIVWKMDEVHKRLIWSMDKREVEMKDYYTMWAHQIKTPIAAVKLLMQRGDRKENISFPVLEEVVKIEQYVEMVLHYLRLENISSDILLKEYQLSEIVKKAVKKYSILFINNHLSLELADLEEMVLTDAKWLSFVVEQILSNAVKYTKEGKIEIFMENPKLFKEEGDLYAVLTVKDSGIGICSEDLPRIFEKGFTGYNGRLDKKSTGIGLYLCREITRKLSHKIVITSVQGEGTRVHICFRRGDMDR